jgi:dynein heavy chain, axonemal
MKLGRDIKHLEVWQNLKDRVDQVKAMLPLITDLKNPALRARHWSQLQEEVGKPLSILLCTT